MWPFKSKPKCEHDWRDTGIRRGYYHGDIGVHLYCPKCRASDIVAESDWMLVEARQHIQEAYNR